MKIKSDSRKIKPGDVFIALKTINNDGHKYIEKAIENGASKVIAEYGSYEAETLIVDDTRKYLEKYLIKNYSYLFEKIKLIGITGTNGKTTSAYLINQALNKLSIKSAYIGTIGFYIEQKIKDLPNTTPDILEIYELLEMAYYNNCQYVVMEVSSQAIDHNRIVSLNFDYTIFTNLTEDHLDYHQTMENYLKCKQQLFNLLKPNGIAIINSDDQYYKNFIFSHNQNITYGFKNSNYQITNYKFDQKSYFTVNDKDNYNMKILGKYNIYNVLIVIILLEQLNIEKAIIKKVVSELTPPVGRMDMINYNDATIIIDYAHTPDAVLNIITTVKEMTNKKIVTIIGCGGDRDKEKRSLMGIIASNLSSYVIFTSDNPRSEDPYKIIQDMIVNISKRNYEIIVERDKAIKKGIQILEKNDILLILGKGHETYQIIKDEKIYFDDKEKVIDIIRR